MPRQASACTSTCSDLAGIGRRALGRSVAVGHGVHQAYAWKNITAQAGHYKRTAQDSIHIAHLSLDSAAQHSHTQTPCTHRSRTMGHTLQASALTRLSYQPLLPWSPKWKGKDHMFICTSLQQLCSQSGHKSLFGSSHLWKWHPVNQKFGPKNRFNVCNSYAVSPPIMDYSNDKHKTLITELLWVTVVSCSH